ncbi:hypothetical protein L6164_011577 [Bauhinia variegata]|uniref:Uncharacterized protein n=1 Tax=Bauhinia variegata TaxID=167791 RepID=A0ACB9PA77_BAUVA|nr:hypothetical protein L6164_011577 [Bauhinia variegata]
MAAREGTPHGLKKARGALKLVKFTKALHSSHHKVLDNAIHKATNREQVLPKEKHVRTILYALSNRTDAAYCIYRLARRLAETYYWTDALKTLLVLHRALRELNTTFCEDLINYSQQEGYIFDVSHLRDDSSPCAGECCAWVRKYALYLEERLRCFGVVKHDVVKYGPKSRNPDILDLFEHLPAQQDLLYRLLLCKVARESVKLHIAITTGVVNVVDKAEKLSELFEFCRSLIFGRGRKFINIKQPPASFITTIEEYIKEAPTTLMIEYNEITDDQEPSPKQNSAPVGDLLTEQEVDVKENSDASLGKNEAVAAAQVADLLGLDDLLIEAAEFETNSLALAVVPTDISDQNP